MCALFWKSNIWFQLMNDDSGKRKTYPLIRCIHFLECPFNRDFTALVSIPFSCAWAGDQYIFSRTTSLLVFLVPKTVLSLWYGGQWVKWNWRILALFCISEGKVVRWQQDLEFNAQMLCNLVSRCFSLFDMQDYLFCRILPHLN